MHSLLFTGERPFAGMRHAQIIYHVTTLLKHPEFPPNTPSMLKVSNIIEAQCRVCARGQVEGLRLRDTAYLSKLACTLCEFTAFETWLNCIGLGNSCMCANVGYCTYQMSDLWCCAVCLCNVWLMGASLWIR